MAVCADQWNVWASRVDGFADELAKIHGLRGRDRNCSENCECGECANEDNAFYSLQNLAILYRGEAVSAKAALEMMDDANRESFPP